MLIPFDKIDAEARVWIYQLNRRLNEKELELLEKSISAFCQSWQAHVAPLTTSYAVFYNQFLLLAVDERSAGASGCSIDGSVRVLKQVGEQLHVDFFDRTMIALLVEDNVSLYSLPEFKELLASGIIKPTTLAFNNLVTNKKEFISSWRQPIRESWLAKYLPKKALA